MSARFVSAAFATGLAVLASAAVAEPRVVASIKPVHSLVAAVMQGKGDPELLLDGAASPHSYSLKPSQAASLQAADLIFWIGPEMETFLERSIAVIGADAGVVALAQADGIKRLKARSGGNFAGHDHIDGHEAGHNSEEGLDSHIWLDPDNAIAFVGAIRRALSDVDPDNAAHYTANARRAVAELERLAADVEAELEPVAGRTFIAFHDAYQHFESRFGVRAAGAVAINPELQPGASHVRAIRAVIRKLGVTCIFTEPQFEPRMVNVIVEGTDVNTATLDPLGATIENGPDLYPDMIRALAGSMRECLGDSG